MLLRARYNKRNLHMGTYTLVGFRPMELMKLEVFCEADC